MNLNPYSNEIGTQTYHENENVFTDIQTNDNKLPGLSKKYIGADVSTLTASPIRYFPKVKKNHPYTNRPEDYNRINYRYKNQVQKTPKKFIKLIDLY